MRFLEGKKKLLFGVAAFLAPYATAYLTGAVSWKEAVRMSALAAVGYMASEGVADAGRGMTSSSQQAAETLAAARRQPATRRRPGQQDV